MKMRLLLLFVVLMQVLSQGAMAQSNVPLMVVRYNQPRVYYDKQLYNVAQKAINIKPDVMFSVVSFVPKASASQDQDDLDQLAARQVNVFTNDLRKMGVPQAQITVSSEPAPDAKFHELYLYVD